MNEYAVAEPDTKGLATIAFFLIGLWTVFVVCLLLDRRFFPRLEKSVHEANPLVNKGT